jgi:hypothetical protein
MYWDTVQIRLFGRSVYITNHIIKNIHARHRDAFALPKYANRKSGGIHLVQDSEYLCLPIESAYVYVTIIII